MLWHVTRGNGGAVSSGLASEGDAELIEMNFMVLGEWGALPSRGQGTEVMFVEISEDEQDPDAKARSLAGV